MAYTDEELAALKEKAAIRNANLAKSSAAAAQSAAAANEANVDYYTNAADNHDYSDIYKSATHNDIGWDTYLGTLTEGQKNLLQNNMSAAADRGEVEAYAGETSDGNPANTAYQAAWERAMNADTVADSSQGYSTMSAPQRYTYVKALANAIAENNYEGVYQILGTLKENGVDISGWDAANLPEVIQNEYDDYTYRQENGVGSNWNDYLTSSTTNTEGGENPVSSDQAKELKNLLGDNWYSSITGNEGTMRQYAAMLSQAGRDDLAAALIKTYALDNTDSEEAYNNFISKYSVGGEGDDGSNNYFSFLKNQYSDDDNEDSWWARALQNDPTLFVDDVAEQVSNNETLNNLSTKMSNLLFDHNTTTYEAEPTYATAESVNSLFTGDDANTTTTTASGNGSTTHTVTQKSALNGGGTEKDGEDVPSTGGDDENSFFSNWSKVNKVLTEGTEKALQTYGEQTATALEPITQAKDAYNYTDQLDNYNQDWENYKEQTASNNAYLDTQKDAAQNWETYMNPLTDYLNEQLAKNTRAGYGSMMSSSSAQNAVNKAIADNTASQYQNAVNNALADSQNNQNIANSQQNNSNSYLTGAQQTLTNNVTPTTDWTAYMTDYADTNLNAQNNLVNAQAQAAASQPTEAESWTDLIKSGASLLGTLFSGSKSS